MLEYKNTPKFSMEKTIFSFVISVLWSHPIVVETNTLIDVPTRWQS